MFHQARFRLTLLYSLIFLILFWGLSFGIYEWMNRYFGDEQGRGNYYQVRHEKPPRDQDNVIIEPASDRVMDEIRNILLIIDGILLFSIPAITWILTGKTLQPVEKAHKREKQFLTDASHDLRTPLAILSGEIEVTLKKDRPKNEYIKILKSNKEEVDNLISLVENMLFFARDNKQYQNTKTEIVDLTDIVLERFVLFKKMAANKKLHFTFTPPVESILINGNTQLLKRLFTSLIDNAIKYTPPKGEIQITLIKEEKSVIVSISDTGIGIPEEHQELVFDRFYRSESSRTEKGYGLGLSIAKQIMDFHNGKIHLFSKVGNGTTMTLLFPQPNRL